MEKSRTIKEAQRLYPVTKSRESIFRTALVPRMTRSGKIFDNRRYSTLSNLANLAIKEEDEEQENPTGTITLTNQEKEQLENTGKMKFGEPTIEDEEEQFVDRSEEQEEGNEENGKTKDVITGLRESDHEEGDILTRDMTPAANIAHDLNPEKVVFSIDEVAQSSAIRTSHQCHELNPDVTITTPTNTVFPVKNRKGKENPNKKLQKKRNNKRRVKAIIEGEEKADSTLGSPPKISCLKNMVQVEPVGSSKTVHWADEQGNAELSQVKEFQEIPRRRCTMFHKVNG